MPLPSAWPVLCTAAVLSATLLPSCVSAQSAPPEPAAHGEVVERPRPDHGAPQRRLYDAPSHPRASLVMLPGGTGEVGIEPDGTLRHGANFVVRTRAAWVARGFAVGTRRM